MPIEEIAMGYRHICHVGRVARIGVRCSARMIARRAFAFEIGRMGMRGSRCRVSEKRRYSPELRELLEYVNNGSITGSLSHMLDEAVDVANSIDDVRRKAMITLEQKRESERRAARKLGKAEERTSIADDLRRVTEKLVELDRIDDVLSLNRNLDRLEEFKAELGIE